MWSRAAGGALSAHIIAPGLSGTRAGRRRAKTEERAARSGRDAKTVMSASLDNLAIGVKSDLLREGELVAGKYIVRARIGSGSASEVFRVHHTALGRDFALKLLRPDHPSFRALAL